MVDHLNIVLGKGLAQPKTAFIQGNTGANTGSGRASQDSKEYMRGLKEVIAKKTTSKLKLMAALKETLAGYFGAPWDAQVNKKVVERWEAIDKLRGNPHGLW